MTPLLQQTLLGNSVRDWLLALLAFALTFTLPVLLRGLVRRLARRHGTHEPPPAVALPLYLLRNTSRLFLLTVALYFAERILTFRGRADRIADIVIVFSFWSQVGMWLLAAVRFGLERRVAAHGDSQIAGSLNIVKFAAGLVIWIVVLLLALDNLGVNITALVAGLGVGGIAIALAVQTILGDLFASLSIALDKPFGVGDLLRVDDFEGVVERIGIKSTRLRSVTGEQIVLSNADLLKSRIRNLQRMSERRALMTVRIAPSTAAERLPQVQAVAARAVGQVPQAHFAYCLLRNIGEWALEYELLFHVPVRGGPEFVEAHDTVNRALLAGLADAGIELAVPPGLARR